MLQKRIDFPEYFTLGDKFRTLQIDGEVFVDYRHNLSTVTDIQLSIEQTFLLYVVKGTVKLVSPDETWLVTAGSLALVRKGSYIMSETLSDDDNRFSAFLFFLSDTMINGFLSTTKEVKIAQNVRRQYVCPVSLTDELRLYMSSIILLISDEAKAFSEEQLLAIKAKELLLLLLQTDEATGVVSIFAQSTDNEETRMRRVMEQQYLHSKTQEELAFLCSMSVSNFKRKFTKYFGTSPGKWIRDKKLDFGYHLLEKSDKTVLQIALEVGYKGSSHFSKEFKSRFGVSPAQVR